MSKRDLIIREGCLLNKRRRQKANFDFWYRLSGGGKTVILCTAAEDQNRKLAMKAACMIEETDAALRDVRAKLTEVTR
jgi:hypothetical protein